MPHDKTQNYATFLYGDVAAAVYSHTMRHGGARTMGLGGDILDFSTSVNPLGMHHMVSGAISAAIPDAADYPDARARALEDAAAAYAGVPAGMVVAGNGATEIIHNICRHTAGRDVLVPSPGFGEYEAAAVLCGSPVSYYDAYPNDIPHVMPQNGCIFACNPSNPAGRLLEKSRILETANAAADAGCMLVVDECFIEMTPRRRESVVPYVKEHDNVVVLRSLTKSFGLAGPAGRILRGKPGYGVCTEEDAHALEHKRAGAGRRRRGALTPRASGGHAGCHM